MIGADIYPNDILVVDRSLESYLRQSDHLRLERGIDSETPQNPKRPNGFNSGEPGL